MCRPAWYRPATIDHTRLKNDKRDFVNLLDSVGEALNAGESLEFDLDEEQLNRWIVGRAEIWPAWQLDLAGLDYPQVSLLDGGRVRLAALAHNGPIEVVLSAVGRCELAGDELLLHVESVKTGKLSIPRGRVLAPLREALEREAGELATMQGKTVRLHNEWTWKNGNRRFRVSRLDIADGVAHVTFEPLWTRP